MKRGEWTHQQTEFYVELGQRVAKARRSTGLTQEEFGALAGVGRTSMANVEAGRQALNLYRIVKLQQVAPFEVPGLDLGDEGSQSRNALVAANRRLRERVRVLEDRIRSIRRLVGYSRSGRIEDDQP